jgi:hypothetical protein
MAGALSPQSPTQKSKAGLTPGFALGFMELI